MKKIIAKILMFIILTVIVFWYGYHFSLNRDNDSKMVSVSLIRANYEYDIRDINQIIDKVDYIFVGEVKDIKGYDYQNPVCVELENGEIKTIYDTYTNYEILVKDCYKGKLDNHCLQRIQKRGGLEYTGDSIAIMENDILPDIGKTYLFFAYKQSDGTILVSGENSNILLTESNFEQLISEVMYAVNNRGDLQ